MEKTQTNSEFALFIRNQTPEAVMFSVELGAMDKQPRMSEYERKALLAANRRRYCAPVENDLLVGSTAVANAGVPFDLEDPKTL